MLRVAIPYGVLSSPQLRKLAHIARTYDRGYGHFTTRQNIQYNWPQLEEVPDILAELADVDMHAIQTSGNCIRNTTSDPFAGVAGDEIIDPRPWSRARPAMVDAASRIRLPAAQVQDRGDRRDPRPRGDPGPRHRRAGRAQCRRRNGLSGRRRRRSGPHADHRTRDPRVPARRGAPQLLRRHPARLQPLRPPRQQVQGADQDPGQGDDAGGIHAPGRARMGAPARRPGHRPGGGNRASRRALHRLRPTASLRGRASPIAPRWPTAGRFRSGRRATSRRTSAPGTRSSRCRSRRPACRRATCPPTQMDAIADLAERYTFGELRVTHEQNLVFADVLQADLYDLWTRLKTLGLATPNIGLLTDIVCCPGGDFCSLANAKSIPIAEAIQRRFDDLDFLHDLGDLELNMSGCMNACGHHHVGNIGILGVDKNGSEWYQISLGGAQGHRGLARQGDRTVVRGGRGSRRDRADHRRLRRRSGIRTRRSSTPCAASASTPSRSASMPQLIKDGALVDDRWTLLPEAYSLTDLPDRGPVIVPLALWLAERGALRARGDVGVLLAPDDDPADLGGDLATLPLIAVDFPQFTDGRGYSTARLLRERHRLQGRAPRGRRRAARPALRDARMRLRRLRRARGSRCRRRAGGLARFRRPLRADGAHAPTLVPAPRRDPVDRRRGAPTYERRYAHRRHACAAEARQSRRTRPRCSRAASAPRTWCSPT